MMGLSEGFTVRELIGEEFQLHTLYRSARAGLSQAIQLHCNNCRDWIPLLYN